MNKTISSSRTPRLRRLSAEEIALWLTVTQSVTPRPGSHLPQAAVPPEPAAPHGPEDQRDESRRRASGMEPVPAPAAGKPAPPNAPLERRLRQKLARGRAAPDAVIDLHGMRRQEAFAALRQFLTEAQLSGARLVLVVTGKGRSGTAGNDGVLPGILRQSLPNWLREPFYHGIVAGFEEAQRPHGGAGAYYVRLRRRERRMRETDAP